MVKISDVTPTELRGTTAKPALIAARPIITVRQALKTMAIHNITSLPIYSHSSDTIVNIVNLTDVLYYIVKEAVADEENPTSLDSEKVHNLDNQIEAVMTLDDEKESYRIFQTDAREGLKETLVAFSKGIHRSMVIDYTNQTPPYILTQTDIVRYVYDHPESLTGINVNDSLESLGLGTRRHEVITGHVNETALKVYRRMAEKNLTGIPIVDGEKKLIGNLSVSDLRGLNYKSIDNLILPVQEFLATLLNSDSVLNPATASPQTTLQQALRSITDRHIHRIWIVDEDRKVLDVVTLSDIIGLFTKT